MSNSPAGKTITTQDSYTLDLKEPQIEYSSYYINRPKKQKSQESNSQIKSNLSEESPSQVVDLDLFFVDLGLAI